MWPYQNILLFNITQDNTIQRQKATPQFGNPLQKGPCQKFFHKTNTIPQNKTTENEKLNFDNPTQTVGFHLQGLQTVAFA